MRRRAIDEWARGPPAKSLTQPARSVGGWRRVMSRPETAAAGATRRKTTALLIPLAGLAAALFLPPLLAGLPLAGQRALIVTLITILLWTGEILAPGVAALLSVTLLALSGATASLREALQGFAYPVPFFLIGGMSWTGWFALMAVPYYAILLLGGALTYTLYRRGFAHGLPTPEPTRRRPISGTEWRTIGIILSASALWLTDGVHHLDPALPALLAFAALLTPGLGPLVWGDLERGVGWANFFVIAASISLAHALGTSGAAPWLGRLLVGGLPAFGDSALAVVVLLMLGATLLRVVVPNISGFLALALPIAMSVGREAGVSPVACALVVMMTGDAVIYYPAQSSSALVIYERGHVSAAEMLRFGLWMTLVGWLAILVVALPWWSLVGQPLRAR